MCASIDYVYTPCELLSSLNPLSLPEGGCFWFSQLYKGSHIILRLVVNLISAWQIDAPRKSASCRFTRSSLNSLSSPSPPVEQEPMTHSSTSLLKSPPITHPPDAPRKPTSRRFTRSSLHLLYTPLPPVEQEPAHSSPSPSLKSPPPVTHPALPAKPSSKRKRICVCDWGSDCKEASSQFEAVLPDGDPWKGRLICHNLSRSFMSQAFHKAIFKRGQGWFRTLDCLSPLPT